MATAVRAFLSPARLALLVLIRVNYSGFVLPEDSDFVMQLMGVFLVDTYERPANVRQRFLARWQRAYLLADLQSHVHSLRPALQRCKVRDPPDDPLNATLWDAFILSLMGLSMDFGRIESYLEEMMKLVDQDVEYAGTVKLNRRSPIGQFLVQSSEEYNLMGMAERCRLLEDLARYSHETYSDLLEFQLRTPIHDALFAAAELAKEGQAELTGIANESVTTETSVPVSLDVNEQLVQVLTDRERLGLRPGASLQRVVDMALTGVPVVPSHTLFFQLLDAWRMGDVNTTYDRLHQFFDLVARDTPGAKYRYNMGPLNKAVLQRGFGETQNDLPSMLEAMRAGRDAQDYNSLRFSLLWLYTGARVRPRDVRTLMLPGLRGQSTDAAQILPYAQEDAEASQHPTHGILAAVMDARVALGDGRPLRFAHARLQAQGAAMAFASETVLEGQLAIAYITLWTRIGCTPLAVARARTFLKTRLHDVPFDDAVRVAGHLAVQYAQVGDYARASTAFSVLDPAGLSSLSVCTYIRHVLLFVQALQEVRAERFADAEDVLLRQMPAVGALTGNIDDSTGPAQLEMQLAVQAALLRVHVLTKQGDGSLSQACAALDALEGLYDKGTADLYVLVQISLARIDLYVAAGHGLRVLTLLVRTVQACLRRRYLALLWPAVGTLVRLLLDADEYPAARVLLSYIIPRALAAARPEIVARLYVHLADVNMWRVGKAVAAVPWRVRPQRITNRLVKQLSVVCSNLSRAQEHYSRASCTPPADAGLYEKQKVARKALQDILNSGESTRNMRSVWVIPPVEVL